MSYDNPLEGHARYAAIGVLQEDARGRLLLALDRSTGQNVAVRCVPRGWDPAQTKYALRELLIHQQLSECRHPHVVELREVFLTPGHLCSVREHVDGEDLAAFLANAGGRVSEALARFLFQQLALALEFCHARGVACRGLKLASTLLALAPGQLPLLKLADFGVSKDASAGHSAPTSQVGAALFVAPEVMHGGRGAPYDGAAVDVWAAGVVLFVLLFGRHPFLRPEDAALPEQAALLALFSRTAASQFCLLPEEAASITPGCADLLSRVLQTDPARRATLPQVLDHPWFRQGLPEGALGMNQAILADAAARPFAPRQPPEEIAALVLHGSTTDPGVLAQRFAQRGGPAPTPPNSCQTGASSGGPPPQQHQHQLPSPSGGSSLPWGAPPPARHLAASGSSNDRTRDVAALFGTSPGSAAGPPALLGAAGGSGAAAAANESMSSSQGSFVAQAQAQLVAQHQAAQAQLAAAAQQAQQAQATANQVQQQQPQQHKPGGHRSSLLRLLHSGSAPSSRQLQQQQEPQPMAMDAGAGPGAAPMWAMQQQPQPQQTATTTTTSAGVPPALATSSITSLHSPAATDGRGSMLAGHMGSLGIEQPYQQQQQQQQQQVSAAAAAEALQAQAVAATQEANGQPQQQQQQQPPPPPQQPPPRPPVGRITSAELEALIPLDSLNALAAAAAAADGSDGGGGGVANGGPAAPAVNPAALLRRAALAYASLSEMPRVPSGQLDALLDPATNPLLLLLRGPPPSGSPTAAAATAAAAAAGDERPPPAPATMRARVSSPVGDNARQPGAAAQGEDGDGQAEAEAEEVEVPEEYAAFLVDEDDEAAAAGTAAGLGGAAAAAAAGAGAGAGAGAAGAAAADAAAARRAALLARAGARVSSATLDLRRLSDMLLTRSQAQLLEGSAWHQICRDVSFTRGQQQQQQQRDSGGGSGGGGGGGGVVEGLRAMSITAPQQQQQQDQDQQQHVG